MKRKNTFEITLLFLLICFNLSLCFMDSERVIQMSKEDGFIETGTAIFYFAAGCLLIMLFINSKSENKTYFLLKKRNIFLLLLGILCIVFAGEEISWGQRIFNVKSSEFFNKYNWQQEINVHNLVFGDLNDPHAKGLVRLLNSNALLYEFLITFCLIIPLLNKYWKKIRILIEKISFPLMPLWLGILVLFNYLACEGAERLGLIGYYQIGEIKEGNFSVLFLIGIISIYKQLKYPRLNFKN